MATTTSRHPHGRRRCAGAPTEHRITHRDNGHTLVELVLVVAILGVLVSAGWLAVAGMTSEAAETGCAADARQLHTAVWSFVAQTDDDEIPPTGTDHDRFERTLVDGGFLSHLSTFHDLAADGGLSPEDPTC